MHCYFISYVLISLSHRCDKCDYSGRSLRYLKNHKKKIHSKAALAKKRSKAVKRQTKIRVVGGVASSSSEEGYALCPKCNKYRKEGSSMINHVKRCGHGPPRVNCDHCDMDFKRREDMQAHALIHMGRVSCPIHNILFKSVNSLCLQQQLPF
jgi:hypothetical protein